MKFSTTQDTAYLKECLAFHVKRRAECWNDDDESGRLYHNKQVKWFEAKLRSVFRSSPTADKGYSVNPVKERLTFHRDTISTPFAQRQEFSSLKDLEARYPVPPTQPAPAPEPIVPATWISRFFRKLRGL